MGKKVTALTALSDYAADEDLVHVVDDPSGTPVDRKGTRKQIVGPAYGEISVEGNATTTTFSGSSTDFTNKVQVTIFDTNGSSDGTTPDHTTDDITIDKAGVFLCELSISFSGGVSNTISAALFKNNGATQITPRLTRKLGTGGDVGNVGVLGLASLSATDTVELWVQNEGATTAVTVEDCVLAVVKVS